MITMFFVGAGLQQGLRGRIATELADRIGITQANVSILKTGKAKAIRFTTLMAICDVLDCQPGDLLAFEREGSPSPQDGAARVGGTGVKLLDSGDRPIAVIKAMRELGDLGLRDAKALVESAPCVVLTGMDKADAYSAMVALRSAGATVEPM